MGAYFPGGLFAVDCSRPCGGRCDGRVQVFILERKPHLVVFSCLATFTHVLCSQLLRRGLLPCRHYFAVIVKLRNRRPKSDATVLQHAFDSACVHSRWQRNDGRDALWSVKTVLASSGHGEGWGAGITAVMTEMVGDPRLTIL